MDMNPHLDPVGCRKGRAICPSREPVLAARCGPHALGAEERQVELLLTKLWLRKVRPALAGGLKPWVFVEGKREKNPSHSTNSNYEVVGSCERRALQKA